LARTTSSACVPTDPVEPRTANRMGAELLTTPR
jgi:hypothetical protein